MSYKTRILTLTFFCCSLALLITGSVLIGFSIIQMRHSAEETLRAQVETAFPDIQKAFLEKNAESAVLELEALSRDETIADVIVILPNGDLFAVAPRFSHVKRRTPIFRKEETIDNRWDLLAISFPISTNEKSLANLYVARSLSDINKQALILSAIFAGTGLFSTLLCLLIARGSFKKLLSQVYELLNVTKRVIKDRDTTIRARRFSTDEMGALTNAFNLMLSELNLQTKELKISESRCRQFFDLGIVGMAILDAGWRWERLNDRFCELLEYAQDELLDMTWIELIHPDEVHITGNKIASIQRNESNGYQMDQRLRRKDGSFITIETSLCCLRDETGRISNYYILIQDISSRKEAEEKQKAAILKAETANKAKDEFLAVMSHELRTPMNSIVGFSQLLEGELDATIIKEYTSLIQKNSADLLALIEKILDYTRFSASAYVCEMGPFEPYTEAACILDAHSNHGKPIQMKLEVDSIIPQCIESDPVFLRQILNNLLQNAVKFTDSGKISLHISASPIAGKEDAYTMTFKVADTGIGIPDDKLAIVFEPFRQADSSFTRKYGGTGLGLAIGQMLANQLGGEIFAKSKTGEGSVFTLTFPCKAIYNIDPITAETDLFINHQGNPNNKSVICAEDEPSNQLLIRALLKKAEINHCVVSDGVQLVDELSRNAYDVVLMDVHMPNMNGWEATRKIREGVAGIENANIHIIGVTAVAQSGDRERCLATGMNDYLSKPLELDHLLKAIDKAPKRKAASKVK